VDVNHVSKEHSEHTHADAALAAAATNGNEEMVRLLIDAGARDDCPGSKKSALLSALDHEKHNHIARLLLEQASPDVSFRKSGGITALHQVQSAELCKTMLDMGAAKTVNAANHRVLLDHGADPSIRSKDSETPLLHAVWGSNYYKTELLPDRSTAEVDVPNKFGETPVTVSFIKGDDKCLELLLRAGAAVDYGILKALENHVYREGQCLRLQPKRPREEMLQLVRDISGLVSRQQQTDAQQYSARKLEMLSRL